MYDLPIFISVYFFQEPPQIWPGQIIVAWRRDPTGIMVISYKRNHHPNGFIFQVIFIYPDIYSNDIPSFYPDILHLYPMKFH
jgi:hypothetical protein